MDLPSEVALQTPQRLIGRLLADVSDHHGGALRGQTLAHRPPDPTASTWVGREEREVRAGTERRKQQPETLLSEASGAQDVSEMKTKNKSPHKNIWTRVSRENTTAGLSGPLKASCSD